MIGSRPELGTLDLIRELANRHRSFMRVRRMSPEHVPFFPHNPVGLSSHESCGLFVISAGDWAVTIAARLCEPQQRHQRRNALDYRKTRRGAKLLRVADPRSVFCGCRVIPKRSSASRSIVSRKHRVELVRKLDSE